MLCHRSDGVLLLMQAECLAHTMPEVAALEEAVAAAVTSSTKDLPPIGGNNLEPPAAARAETAPDELPTSTFDPNAPRSNALAHNPHAGAAAAVTAATIAILLVV